VNGVVGKTIEMLGGELGLFQRMVEEPDSGSDGSRDVALVMRLLVEAFQGGGIGGRPIKSHFGGKANVTEPRPAFRILGQYPFCAIGVGDDLPGDVSSDPQERHHVATGDRTDHRQFRVDRFGIGPGRGNYQVGRGCRKGGCLVPLPMMKSTEATIERRLGGTLPSNGDLMPGAA